MKAVVKFVARTLVVMVGFGVLFEGVSALMRPRLPNKIEPRPAEQIENVRALRTVDIDPSHPLVIQREVDYADGQSAAWYPRNEAPVLHDLGLEKKLPPLPERIAAEPLVLDGVDHEHNYGGTWFRLANSATDATSIMNRLGYPNLVRFSPNGYPIVPHVCKRFWVSSDNREFTFVLRKGMKWSDGVPFTVDDIMYFWEMEQSDKSLNPQVQSVFIHRGKVPRFTKVDDTTFKIAFEDPYGQFIDRVAGAYGRTLCNSPAHYLRQFHPRLGDRLRIEDLKNKLGLSTDKAVYLHVARLDNPELPRITPWIIRKEPGSSASEAVRNPYYWAVDVAGNQLPYIDRILFTQRSENMVTLSAVEGSVSMQEKFIDTAMYTLIMEKSVTENFDVYHWINNDRNSAIVQVNQNYRPGAKDPGGLKIKALLEDVRFRRALSLSLDRKALIEGLYDGRTQPANAVPGPESLLYNPDAFQRWTQFAPAEANRLLDEIGLVGRDREGFRTLPDGSGLKLFLSVVGSGGEAGQLFVDQWSKVGLRVILRIQGQGLFISQMRQGELQLFCWGGYSWLDALPPLPFASGCGTWFMKGGLEGNPEALKGGSVAPEEGTPLFRYVQAYDNALQHSDPKKVKQYIDQMTFLLADQQWSINVSTPLPALAIVSKEFKNVPKHLTLTWALQSPGNGGVETFCFSRNYLSGPDVRSRETSYLPGVKAQILGPIGTASTPAGRNNGAQTGREVPVIARIIKGLLIAFCVLMLAVTVLRHPYIAKRMTIMVPTLFLISVIVFVVIQLPAGNYITTRIAELQQTGETLDEEQIREFNEMFYLEDPMPVQYARWMGLKWFTSFADKDKGLLQGCMGRSMVDQRVVNDVVAERILLTFCISLFTIIFTWCIAIPIGIYSAVRQYSVTDYVMTFLGFIGMCIPGFLLALLLMYVCKVNFGFLPTGLFSEQMGAQPYWDWPKVVDLARHIWVPVLIMGVGGTTAMIRVMRANLLDELRKPYVVTARAKGVRPVKLLLKYPVRIALNPFISGIGGIFPALVSGGAIVAIVLSLPTVGPLLLSSVMDEDMYMAGSLLLSLSLLSMIGVLFSDLLLMAVDPRIRYERQGKS